MVVQLLQLISVHFKEFWREPGIIFWALFFPILMALGLGMAFTKRGELVRTVAVVTAEGIAKMEFFKSGQKSEDGIYTTIKIGNEKLGLTNYRFIEVEWDQAVQMLQRGKTNLIIKSYTDSVQYYFDPSNPDAQLIYIQLFNAIKGNKQVADPESIKPLKQEGTRYVDFLIPGLMAMGIMMTCMWGISYTNVDRRNKKLLRRMVATPMRKYNYLAAQFISRLTLSAIEAIVLIVFSIWVFNIKIEGSLPALIILFISGNITFTGIAMLVSSRTSIGQIVNGLINVVVLPMMILSGIYFSYHNFPDFIIPIIKVLPLTMLADNVRSIFLEGFGFSEILPTAGILTIIGIVFYSIGLKVFKWY